jgi:hypothetical protein
MLELLYDAGDRRVGEGNELKSASPEPSKEVKGSGQSLV